jgi:RNA polymerase sigma-70 factor, ECF subfamily
MVDLNSESSQLADWLMLARQGDESARNRLFEACRSFVALTARVQLHRRLQTKVDPSDLVQQSMLEAHRGFENFRGQTPEEWLAWLKQIVQHNVLDADKHYRGTNRRDLRRERTISDPTSSHTDWSPADPGPTPSQLLSKAERELQVAVAIESLPEDYRQVVLLRNLERLSFDDVAERMNRTRGACQMLWMRAVEQLRAKLNQDFSVS